MRRWEMDPESVWWLAGCFAAGIVVVTVVLVLIL